MHADDGPILAFAIAFWAENRAIGELPTRKEIDPLRIPPRLFPHLILAEVMTAQGQVRYRVVGDEMVHRWGTNFAGRRSDEIFSGDYRAYLESAFAMAIKHWQPVFTASRFRWDVDGFLWTRRVMLPIGATPQGPVTQVLVVQTWPNSREDCRTEPKVIEPGTAPVENAEAVLMKT